MDHLAGNPRQPNRPIPFVFYRHAAGNIVLEPQPTDEGIRWRLASSTIDDDPAIYHATKSIPLPHDRGAPHFSDPFLIRSQLEDPDISVGLISFGKSSLNFEVGHRSGSRPTRRTSIHHSS